MTFLVFALAFGARNPIRWGAWGAIIGPAAFAAILVSEQHSRQPVAYQPPTYTPAGEQPAKPNGFDDLIPPQPYKVPLNEQHRSAPGDAGMY